jgi:hypothetical protein
VLEPERTRAPAGEGPPFCCGVSAAAEIAAGADPALLAFLRFVEVVFFALLFANAFSFCCWSPEHPFAVKQ